MKDHTWVADSVSSSLRKDDLSFSHHKEVAPLEPERQEYFLNKAPSEKLSVRELREKVKKSHEDKVRDMEVLSDLNQEIETEKELKEVAHRNRDHSSRLIKKNTKFKSLYMVINHLQ